MIKKFKAAGARLLPKNQFARGVSVLVGGTAGSQLIMVLAAPLLTRLYTPEDFGLLAVYAGLLALLTVVASLRYELAIPLPEDEQEAANIAVLSLLIVSGISLLSALIVFFAGGPVAGLLGVPQLTSYFWLLPVGVFFVGIYQVFNYWAIRRKDFPAIASTRIKQALTTLLIQLTGYKLGPVMLIAGQAAGQSMGSFSLGKIALKNTHFNTVSSAGIIAVAKRYQKFSIYSTLAGFFNTASTQLPPILFAVLFSPTLAGLYALAHRLLAMPMGVIGGAIGNVFLGNSAKAYRDGSLGKLTHEVHSKLSAIAAPPILFFFIIAPDFFEYALGDNWREAGEIAQWLSPWLYLAFTASPISSVITTLEKQAFAAFFDAFMLLARLAAILTGFYIGSDITSIQLFSITSAGLVAAYITIVFKLLNLNCLELLTTHTKNILISLVICLPLIIASKTNTFTLLGGLFSALLILARYYYLAKKQLVKK
ncbi:oligosaccharide flippase family protein [Pseudomonas silesiensis]|uniref:oligosaccharide flippase family protein n=1 Tax=Pseudomonas silesiensis TaxID=1853130 RepID=UPI0034D5BB62